MTVGANEDVEQEPAEPERCDDCGSELDAEGDCRRCIAFGDDVDLRIDELSEED